MKLVVIMDSDGHFRVADINNRKKVLNMLKDKIHDGDYWANEIGWIEDEWGAIPKTQEEWDLVPKDAWEEFVNYFVQRGMMEIVEI